MPVVRHSTGINMGHQILFSTVLIVTILSIGARAAPSPDEERYFDNNVSVNQIKWIYF